MTQTAPPMIVAGVDSHTDTIHVAVIDGQGRDLADSEFPTTSSGYDDALVFIERHGCVERIGVEGTSSYGAGFVRAARAANHTVVEVNRPDRAARRRVGKSDVIDAYLAARAVLSGQARAVPKDASIVPLRALLNAKRSAVKARTAAMNQLQHMLVISPESVRATYRGLKRTAIITALLSAPASADASEASILAALGAIAQRIRFLDDQISDLTDRLDAVVTAANPGLRSAHGIGPDVAAQLLITAGAHPDRLTSEAALAALCGVAPVPASSGKTTRHRLSRGGDRYANNALYSIALVRMSTDERTRSYVARQRILGRSTPEIIRMLKRAIVREVFRLLTTQVGVPDVSDLRPARQARGLTLKFVAAQFGVWPTAISRIERGARRDDTLADAYRQWLRTGKTSEPIEATLAPIAALR